MQVAEARGQAPQRARAAAARHVREEQPAEAWAARPSAQQLALQRASKVQLQLGRVRRENGDDYALQHPPLMTLALVLQSAPGDFLAEEAVGGVTERSRVPVQLHHDAVARVCQKLYGTRAEQLLRLAQGQDARPGLGRQPGRVARRSAAEVERRSHVLLLAARGLLVHEA